MTASLQPVLKPRTFSSVGGTLSTTSVLLENVQICGCWSGLNDQSQKKVKFKITNNTTSTSINLAGGPDSSIYLIATYPQEFTPVLKMPETAFGTRPASLPSAGTPANKPITMASETRLIEPVAITSSLLEELGVVDGWRAWAIPANPNRVVEQDPLRANYVTFPTWVTDDWIGPGETYYETDVRGVGDWVFYLPLPPDVAWMASSEMMSTLALDSRETDRSYKVLGVAVLDQSGTLLGFAPLPPETVWSHAADF